MTTVSRDSCSGIAAVASVQIPVTVCNAQQSRSKSAEFMGEHPGDEQAVHLYAFAKGRPASEAGWRGTVEAESRQNAGWRVTRSLRQTGGRFFGSEAREPDAGVRPGLVLGSRAGSGPCPPGFPQQRGRECDVQ